MRISTILFVFLAWGTAFQGTVFFPETVFALETLIVRRSRQGREDGANKTLLGRVLLEGFQEKVVFQTRDGQIFLLDTADIVDRKTDDERFTPLSREEIALELRTEFGDSFSVHTSDHYVLAYNTSMQYAQLCGKLLDRVFDKYRSVWSKVGLAISEPEFPLVAVVFEDKEQFNRYGADILGDSFHVLMNAYYHPYTNRIVLCDLSGIEARFQDGDRNISVRRTGAILSRPGAGRNVSAIMHEAAHQIGFNDGMFPRLAEVPVWLCEGIAVMHELPDVENPRRNENGDPGKVNRRAQRQLLAYLHTAPPDPVRELIRSDQNIRTLRTASGNYGLAWALSYYLYKRKPEEFRRYLSLMAEKRMYVASCEEERLKDFEDCFGNDWTKFHRDFARFVKTLK